MRFTGFSPKGIEFLDNLRKNNRRKWFLKHKSEYQENLYEPFKALVAELMPTMEGIDSDLVTEPHRAVSRIYRDTRFTKNKLPYRSAMWFSFHRRMLDWKDAPVFFMEISLSGYQYGMGFYQAQPTTMMKFRKFVDFYPEDFLNAISFFNKKHFCVDGDYYKRRVENVHPASVQPFYQAKTFFLTHVAEHDQILFSRRILSVLKRNFESLKPLYDFLWRAKQWKIDDSRK
ncbi:MAG: DUF2461 domain-containing protein [Planctomycetia bacterium]|nr:DUF2461 domain-containing protein [Planctomycetia bacterium]